MRTDSPLAGLAALLLLVACGPTQVIHVPDGGYRWPSAERAYWPTDGWITAPPEEHGLDAAALARADGFARADSLSRALLVVKDGYLVFERYYGDGGADRSTNLWSVTKSVTSALVGIVADRGLLDSTDRRMAELMPDYPEFGAITLHHVLTQTTGLDWKEEGPPWAHWIESPDWVREALARGFVADPGERFFYSSGNSHFLSALIAARTSEDPGWFAKANLFDPLGIPFTPIHGPPRLHVWNHYLFPRPQSWHEDPAGNETAGFGLYLTARDMAKFGFLYVNHGRWDGRQIVSEAWVDASTRDQVTNVYGRYSYGYQWWITKLAGRPGFLASGYGGQIIGVVPSLDLVVVIKYDAENPEHPKAGTAHDDMHLFELAVEAATGS
jgi:CubicO group peptidase (beta-lactamase class C family)